MVVNDADGAAGYTTTPNNGWTSSTMEMEFGFFMIMLVP